MAEVGEAVEGRSLADLCVAGQTSGEIHPDTHRCRLNFLSPEGADVSVAFVPIVHVEGKLLVAVPFVAWHRTASRRLLPKGALSKPVPVEVSGTLVEEAAEEESIDITTKAWVGFLSAELLQAAVIGEPEEGAITAEFGEELEVRVQLSALVLVAIADEHFSFVSAQSGPASVAASPSLRSAAGGRLEERLEKLETAFQEVRGSLGGLSEVVSFVRKQKSKGGDAGAAAKKQEPNLCPGLDPAVVAAARQSGFPEDQFQKLAALARKPVRMDDVPPKKPRQRGVLSESEEDEADLEGEDEEATAEGPPIERAILQLTKVVKTLAKSKQGRARRHFRQSRRRSCRRCTLQQQQSGTLEVKGSSIQKVEERFEGESGLAVGKCGKPDGRGLHNSEVGAWLGTAPGDITVVAGAPQSPSQLSHVDQSCLADCGHPRLLAKESSGRSQSTSGPGSSSLRPSCPGWRKLAACPRTCSRAPTSLLVLPGEASTGAQRASVVSFGRREVFGVSPLAPERPGLLLRKQKEAEPGLQRGMLQKERESRRRRQRRKAEPARAWMPGTRSQKVEEARRRAR